MLDTSSESAIAMLPKLRAETKVGLEVTLIADGLLDDGENALVSLVVLPRLLDKGEVGGVELARWPELLHKAFADPANPVDDQRIMVDQSTVPARRIGLPNSMPSYTELNEAWEDALRLDDPTELKKIKEMLHDDDKSLRDAKVAKPLAIFGYDVCCIARQMGRLHGALSALQAARLIAQEDGAIEFDEAAFLNKHSSASLQSTSATALFTNGTGQISLTEDERRETILSEIDPDLAEQIGPAIAEMKSRLAWTGRVRPGAADQMGFGGDFAARRNDARNVHQARDVVINRLSTRTTEWLLEAQSLRQKSFQSLYGSSALTRALPDTDDRNTAFEALDRFTLDTETTERQEALQRVLLGLSDTLVPSDDLSARGQRNTVHGIDIARGAYEIAMVPDSSQFKRALSPEKNGVSSDTVELSEPSTKQRFDRRLSGLLAYPEVARMFGLIIDLKVALSDIQDKAGGTAAEITGGPQNLNVATIRRASAVTLGTDRFEPQSIFDSAAHKDMVEEFAPLFKDGLVQLADTHRLLTLDVNQIYEGAKNAAGSDETSLSHGEPVDRVTSVMTTPRTAGLVLVDTVQEKRVELDLVLANLDEAKPMRPLFLEDVITGYRIDIGRVEDNGITWAQASQRRIKFPDLNIKLKLDLGVDVPELRARDRTSGSIRSPNRLVDMQTTEKEIVVPFQTVCTWRNWTFGTPSIKQEVDIEKDDVQIDVEYGIDPNGPKMMSQRIGNSYVMGARAVAMNGSSLSFDEARDLYSKDNIASRGVEREESVRLRGIAAPPKEDKDAVCVLRRPTGFGGGYPVYRHDPIGAPKLFLNAKHAPKQRDPYLARDYQTHLDEVIATSQNSDRLKWPTTPRYLLVDASSFDQCLMDGVLDDHRFKEALPKNSYPQIKAWPDPRIGETNPVQNPTVANAKPLYRNEIVQNYWADPKAEVMFIAFFKDGEPAPQEFYPSPLAINLYPKGYRWPNAMAVEIKVEPVVSAGPISGSRQRAGFRVKQSPGIVHVTIDIEPAEITEIRAWCMPREPADLAKMGGYETLIRVAGELSNFWGASFRSGNGGSRHALSAIANSLDTLLDGDVVFDDNKSAALASELFHPVMLHDGTRMNAFRPGCLAPLHGISHSLKFEAVHAVAAPLKAPEITSFWMVHELNEEGDPDTLVLVDDARDAPPEDPHFERWRTGLLNGTLPLTKSDPRQRQTSQRVLLGGMIGFDRRSTSELKLHARWLDYSPAMPILRDSKTQTCRAQPVEKIYEMADLGGLAYELGAGRENAIDLAATEGGQQRLLTLDLDSTRAARLWISAKAVSRFSRYYDDKTATDLMTLEGDEIEMWLPSTRRPDEPRPAGVESAIQFSADGTAAIPMQDMTVLTSARRAVRLRIDLGEQWYSSGEGEQLGVACYPTRISDRSELGETTYLGEKDDTFANFTTWGRDPIFETGELGRYVTTDQFVNAAGTVVARLPIARSDDGQSVTRHADCDLALFDVACDPDTGRHYVDIEVDPEESYNAFIRLQLVRHQACALTGLETSIACPLMASLLPARQVRILQTDRGFELSYSGVTYRNMSGACSVAAETLPKTPHLDVFVLRRANGASGLPVEAPGYGTIEEASALELRPDMSGDIGTWRVEVTEEPQPHLEMPSVQIAPGNLANGVLVLMRESETYLADPVVERNAADSTPLMLQTVNRAVASISITLSRMMPSSGSDGKD